MTYFLANKAFGQLICFSAHQPKMMTSVIDEFQNYQLPFYRKLWSQSGSNRRHLACKASALPAELWPRRNLTCLPCRLRETASVTSFSRHPGKLGLIVLQAKQLVGLEGLEPSTSPLSGVRSNHLSYRPKVSFRVSTSS